MGPALGLPRAALKALAAPQRVGCAANWAGELAAERQPAKLVKAKTLRIVCAI
jgi:hypothetical protein